ASTFRDGFVVLNADDPWCVEMTSRARGEIIFFTMDEDNEKVKEHVRARGKAVILREWKGGEVIFLVEGRRETALLDVRYIPATFEGRARVNIKNAMAAAGAAYGSNVGLEAIRNGLRSFSASFFQAPGRLNLLEVGGYRVIVDYCHNVAGLEELAEFVKRMLPTRTVGMIAMPGDRRDEDIERFGTIASTMFDEIVIREDKNPRGRKPGEVAELLKQTLIANGIAPERVTIVLDEIDAANTALNAAQHDDLVVLLVDKPAEVWETVVERSTHGWSEERIPAPA
ncbi:MAG TPA: cyanophycin synthetase, partial [Thermomicrobiales bacterium]|nr:cyanophycin synthetase [Thermomicrobiales bacterium]